MSRSLISIPALAIGLAIPAAAQQLSEQEAAQIANSVGEAFRTAVREKDPARIAAFFTKDAIRVTPNGLQNGRAEIQKFWTDVIKDWEPGVLNVVRVVPIDNNVVLAVFSWAGTYHSPNGPVGLRGYDQFTLVHDGGGWKIRMETYNETPAPPPAQPKQ